MLIKFPGPPWTTADVDSVFMARIPTDAEEAMYPGITALIVELHVHGHTERCGELTGRCTFGFPQPPVAHTYCDAQGRWHLRRGPADAMIAPCMFRVLINTLSHTYATPAMGTVGFGYLLGYNCKGDPRAAMAIARAHGEAEDGHAVDEIKVCFILPFYDASTAVSFCTLSIFSSA